METKHTPGPWRACCESECKCGQIWSPVADHPVATVISGQWGDKHPAIRLVGKTSFNMKAEAYMDFLPYGTVDPEVAKANARLITAAPDLLAELEWAVSVLDALGGPSVQERKNAAIRGRAAIAKAKGE